MNDVRRWEKIQTVGTGDNKRIRVSLNPGWKFKSIESLSDGHVHDFYSMAEVADSKRFIESCECKKCKGTK